jgi:hypothetical protein
MQVHFEAYLCSCEHGQLGCRIAIRQEVERYI